MDTPRWREAVVVGGGPAGLATAACLGRRGIAATVLDRGRRVGDAWRWRYDRLHLHTPRLQSHLPGHRIPRRMGRWVSRDDMVGYLVEYAGHHGLEPVLGVQVERLERDGDRYAVVTDRGTWTARSVVVATGYNNGPVVPDWPGREGFTGELLHARDYMNAEPFAGRRVLVVGSGNTGAEIATDLAESGAASVWLSVRMPPNIIPRQVGFLPTTLFGVVEDSMPAWLVDPVTRLIQKATIGDLTTTGLPAPEAGVAAQARRFDAIPIIDVGLVEQLRAGAVVPVAAVEGFDGSEVGLADGAAVSPDVVIAATGYDPLLEGLVGHMGLLDESGRPRVTGGRTDPASPGVYFVGLSNPLKGLLLQINLDARAAARAMARRHRGRGEPNPG